MADGATEMNRIAQPLFIEKNHAALVDMLGRGSANLAYLKNNLSSVFEKVGAFLLDSSRELDSFRKIIKPYLEYFYPMEINPDTDCFVNEVVEPSRLEMVTTINRAVSIMQGDGEVNGRVSKAIREALDIQPIVNNLLEMIEAIETYSWNAMLVSTKAGVRGRALAKISEQVSGLSALANRTAEDCTAIIDNLNTRYDEFDGICHEIGIINENYLTQMTLKGGMMFREMRGELNNLSGSVNNILDCAGDVEGAISGLMNRLQMEDLVRQDIEKVMYLLEEMAAGRDRSRLLDALYRFDDEESVDGLLVALMARKFTEINEHTRPLVEGTERYCDDMKGIINGFLSRFYGRQNTGEKGYYEGTKFDEICSKLERMKDEFVGYMEEIISSKKNLYNISVEIVATMGRFGFLFEEIGKISRRFEIINMLTKIELAKHNDLKRSIGGSLSDVSNLPAVMKKIVENAMARHREVMGSIERALGEYHGNYEAEEETLTQCIDAMRKISVKMFESQKYYRDISEKVGGTGMGLLTFMETREEEWGVVKEIGEIIYNFMFHMEEYGAGTVEEAMADPALVRHVKAVNENLAAYSGDEGYRTMQLRSLLGEAVRVTGGDRVMLF